MSVQAYKWLEIQSGLWSSSKLLSSLTLAFLRNITSLWYLLTSLDCDMGWNFPSLLLISHKKSCCAIPKVPIWRPNVTWSNGGKVEVVWKVVVWICIDSASVQFVSLVNHSNISVPLATACVSFLAAANYVSQQLTAGVGECRLSFQSWLWTLGHSDWPGKQAGFRSDCRRSVTRLYSQWMHYLLIILHPFTNL